MFRNQSENWTEYISKDLSNYADSTIRLGFTLVTDDALTVSPGWYIDDISIDGFETNVSNVDFESYNIRGFILHPNFPSPFRASTTFIYTIPKESDIQLTIFDLLGRKVDVLIKGPVLSGTHTLNWTPGDLSSGVYFLQLIAPDVILSRPIVLQR